MKLFAAIYVLRNFISFITVKHISLDFVKLYYKQERNYFETIVKQLDCVYIITYYHEDLNNR